MKHFCTIMTVLLLLCSAGSGGETAHVHTTTLTKLTVKVTNSTANGTTVEGDIVIIHIFQDDQVLVTLEGKADANGIAEFENVPAGVHVGVLPRARHRDMMFEGQHAALTPGQGGVTAEVTVYDVSFDKSQLSIGAHHMKVEIIPDALKFTEYMLLKNSSDMAISSSQRDEQDKPIVLEMLLPEGFKNLETISYFDDNAVVITENGFYDTMAVPPGQFSLNFSYTLDVASKTLDIVKGFSLPTSSFVLFAELGQAKIEGFGEPSNQATGPSGAQIEYYQRSKLDAGAEVSFQITGFNIGGSGSNTWIILAVVFGAVVLAALVRRRPAKS